MPGFRRVGFLSALVNRPNVEIGDYTYYDDPRGPEHFLDRCVLHHFDFIGDKLIIGRFCAIATGVQFIMNGANHVMSGFSTYPFNFFRNGWETDFERASIAEGFRGDTVVGNDVWIGHEATILPGVRIGDGAIIGAKAVVAADVPPYAVVVGNPGRVARRRFSDETIAALLAIRWWDWDVEKISRNLNAIRGADLDALRAAA
jgi:virginiamycin A acetyltransferase